MSATVEAVDDKQEVRSVVVPLNGMQLLLPNSLLAEVFGYVTPDPIANAPHWLLGSVGWRGVVLPLISFESLVGGKVVPPGIKGRVIVIYSLGEQVEKVPYIGLLATDIPRLLRASAATLQPVPDQGPVQGVSQMALVNGEPSVIPDIDYLTGLLGKVLS